MKLVYGESSAGSLVLGRAARNIAKIKNPSPFPIKKKPKMPLE
jgi:hypothetical protein